VRELKNFPARINLFAIFAQPGGVQLDGRSRFSAGVEEAREQCGAILFWDEAKFLRQIGVAHDLKKTSFSGHGHAFEINRPDFERIAILPFRQLKRTVHRPGIGNVMD
jgi:hypothetical protein